MAENDGYGKRPLWQWIVIYLVIGGVIYFLVYYFVLAKNGVNYGTSTSGSATPSSQQAIPSTNSAY